MLSFALYLIGSLVCISGLAWIVTLLGGGPVYVTGTAAVLFVIAVVAAASHRRALEAPAR